MDWSNYWQEKWAANDIAFHQSQVNAHLIQYFTDELPGKVLVPLCGKTRDMRWLAERGHDVIGVELSEMACVHFFAEQGLAYRKESTKDFTIFHGEKISIWCGDFFKFPKDSTKEITAVYDRAALIALPENLRSRYADQLTALCPAETRILLLTIEYDQTLLAGPPFSVSREEVRARFGAKFRTEELASPLIDDGARRNPKLRALPELREHVMRLVRV